jgi:hypothetical protein
MAGDKRKGKAEEQTTEGVGANNLRGAFGFPRAHRVRGAAPE